MRSYWMFRLFFYAFVGCLFVVCLNPVNIVTPSSASKDRDEEPITTAATVTDNGANYDDDTNNATRTTKTTRKTTTTRATSSSTANDYISKISFSASFQEEEASPPPATDSMSNDDMAETKSSSSKTIAESIQSLKEDNISKKVQANDDDTPIISSSTSANRGEDSAAVPPSKGSNITNFTSITDKTTSPATTSSDMATDNEAGNRIQPTVGATTSGTSDGINVPSTAIFTQEPEEAAAASLAPRTATTKTNVTKTATTRKVTIAKKTTIRSSNQEGVGSLVATATATATATRTNVTQQDLNLRLCRITPAPIYGQERNGSLWSRDWRHPLHILKMEYFRYRCAGHPYHNYMEKHMLPYIHQKQLQQAANSDEQQWGKRPSILPPPTNQQQNRSIMIIGNSHTQQMTGSLLCQYSDQIVKNSKLQTDNDDSIEYRLIDGTRIYVLMNHAAVYSKRWRKNLEDVLGRNGTRLNKMDAILMGHINEYDPQYEHANLWNKVRDYGAKQYPHYEINATKYPTGFTFHDLAQVYKGNIVWISMTALYNQNEYNEIVEEIQNMTATNTTNNTNNTTTNATKRTNLYAINARRHILEMQGVECSSDDNKKVGTCSSQNSSRYSNGHKCMGDSGGMPDLVAWDVVEMLWKIFGGSSMGDDDEVSGRG